MRKTRKNDRATPIAKVQRNRLIYRKCKSDVIKNLISTNFRVKRIKRLNQYLTFAVYYILRKFSKVLIINGDRTQIYINYECEQKNTKILVLQHK